MSAQRLNEEIIQLRANLLSLSHKVEMAVTSAIKSIRMQDIALAEQVVQNDVVIDQIEVEVEEHCLQILALYQPVASDLRDLVCVIKVNNDLERIGDLSVNIARRTKRLVKANVQPQTVFDFKSMSDTTQKMLNLSLEALDKMDSQLSRSVFEMDEQVDSVNRNVFKDIPKLIETHPEKAAAYLQCLNLSQNLERIADHATNIAENVIYLRESKIVRHEM